MQYQQVSRQQNCLQYQCTQLGQHCHQNTQESARRLTAAYCNEETNIISTTQHIITHIHTTYKFFADKLRRITCEIETRLSVSTRSPPAMRTASHVTLSDFGIVTVDEVAKVIKLLLPKSSPLDLCHCCIAERICLCYGALLARLANLSFTTGIFLSWYKLGHVIPILKKPTLNISNPANYHPVTNLCTFSKILEKLALARLRPHVLSSVNFSRFQSAYRPSRPGYSTETALLKVVNDTEHVAGEGNCSVLLALDISAAFDAVDHSVLCKRAQVEFGVNGTVLDWLQSFVTDRSQYIQGCSGAGTRGNTVPINIFVWERRSHRHFCSSGNGVPTARVHILTSILKIIPNALVQQ